MGEGAGPGWMPRERRSGDAVAEGKTFWGLTSGGQWGPTNPAPDVACGWESARPWADRWVWTRSLTATVQQGVVWHESKTYLVENASWGGDRIDLTGPIGV